MGSPESASGCMGRPRPTSVSHACFACGLSKRRPAIVGVQAGGFLGRRARALLGGQHLAGLAWPLASLAWPAHCFLIVSGVNAWHACARIEGCLPGIAPSFHGCNMALSFVEWARSLFA